MVDGWDGRDVPLPVEKNESIERKEETETNTTFFYPIFLLVDDLVILHVGLDKTYSWTCGVCFLDLLSVLLGVSWVLISARFVLAQSLDNVLIRAGYLFSLQRRLGIGRNNVVYTHANS